MELDIFWSEFSERELESIFEFYKNKSNSSPAAKKIVSGI